MLDDQEVRRLLIATGLRDTGAFERLYKMTAPLLLGVAQRIVGRRELAEDVMHDCFLKIWRSAGAFDPLAPHPVAWMVAIIRHRALDLVSSAAATRSVALADDDVERAVGLAMDDFASADQELEADQRAGAVRGCIDGLKETERESLVLAYHHGLSHGDLARRLGKPLGTVKGWVRRAMENMRHCLEARLGDVR